MTQHITAPFVGRELELEALRGELELASSGQSRVAIVEGVAGIGKTALVERFLRTVGVAVVRAEGEEAERDFALGVVDQLVRRAGAAPLDATTVDHIAAGAHLLEVIGALAPVVVVIDDAQWADVVSLRALLFAVRRLVSDPVLTLLTVRAGEDEQLPPGLRTGTTIELEPLGADELHALARELGVELSAHAAARLRAHTDGNPLYGTALLRELPAERFDEVEGSWPAPRSFAAVVRTRAAACPAPARRLLDAVAVLGTTCALDAATALAELSDPFEAIEAAADAGLLRYEEREGRRTLAFTHPLGRAAIYDAMGFAIRARLHARAASIVATRAAALQHRVAASAGYDDALADDLEAFAGGERARGAWPGYATSMVAASRLSSDCPVRERRLLDAADAALYAGEPLRARRLVPAIEQLPAGPRRDKVLALIAITEGQAEHAGQLLSRAWTATGEGPLAAAIAQGRAVLEFHRMNNAATVDWGRRANALTADGDIGVALITWSLALSLDQLGRGEEALALVAANIERLPEPLRRAGVLADIRGAILLSADRLPEALEALAGSAPAARRGSLVAGAFAYSWLATAEYRAGAWDDAQVHAELACALADEASDPGAQAHARVAAIIVPAGRGELHETARLADELAALPVGSERRAVAVRLGRAHHASAAGDAEQVVSLLAGLPALDGSIPALYIDALIDHGDLAEAARAVDRPMPPDRPWISAIHARTRGRIEAARKRRDAAEASFRAALAQTAALGMPFEQARTELDLGHFLRREGQRRAAATQLAAAKERLTQLDARPLLQHCERELEACGLTPMPRKHPPTRGALTPRERAVAGLAASGLTNREIAAELLLSVKTVERHLTHVFAKRGVRSRSQLAD